MVAFGLDGEEIELTHDQGLDSAALAYQERMGDINSPETPVVVEPPPLPKEPEPTGDGTCDQELKDAVNNYEPFINIPYLNCGTWYTQQFHSSGKIMLLFKNGCTPTFKAVISVTMKNSDWEVAKTTLYADGVKFSPLLRDSCTSVDTENTRCDIKLATLNGVEQDSAGFLIPAGHGDLGFAV